MSVVGQSSYKTIRLRGQTDFCYNTIRILFMVLDDLGHMLSSVIQVKEREMFKVRK